METDPCGYGASSSGHAQQLDMAFESIVRRKPSLDALTEDASVTTANVRIKLVSSSEEQAAADRFLAMRYAWRGYVADSNTGDQASDKKGSLNYFTLLAYREDQIAGTL